MSDDHFDIEHFPTSPSAVRMLSRISPIYDKSYVGKWIFEVMGLEMDDVRLRFDELKAQAFPETATWGLVYWEQRYGITGDRNALLEERRRRVIAARSTRSPMNPARVEQIIEGMTGRETTVEEDVAPYTFSVEIEGADSGVDLDAVIARLKKIKPSHQTYELRATHQPEDAVVSVGGAAARYSVTPLPEWVMDHSVNDTITLQASAGSFSQTALPEWRMEYEFNTNAAAVGQHGAFSVTPLPPAAE